MTENVPNTMPPIKIAFVIDNEVADVLHTDERLSAIFLSNPLIIDVTEKFDSGNPVMPNSKYDPETKTFTLPEGYNVG